MFASLRAQGDEIPDEYLALLPLFAKSSNTLGTYWLSFLKDYSIIHFHLRLDNVSLKFFSQLCHLLQLIISTARVTWTIASLVVWDTVGTISWWNSIISCFSWVAAMSRRSLAFNSTSIGVGCSSCKIWSEWTFSNRPNRKYSYFWIQHGGVADWWLQLSVGFFTSGFISGATY